MRVVQLHFVMQCNFTIPSHTTKDKSKGGVNVIRTFRDHAVTSVFQLNRLWSARYKEQGRELREEISKPVYIRIHSVLLGSAVMRVKGLGDINSPLHTYLAGVIDHACRG